MNTSLHIIDKIVVDVNTTNMETALTIKDDVSVFLKENVFPKIEDLLAKYDDPEKIIQIDALAIETETNQSNDFRLLEGKIIGQLSEKLVQIIGERGSARVKHENERSVKTHSIEERDREAFLFFLKKGSLPWFGTEKGLHGFVSAENWFKQLENSNFVSKLKTLLREDDRAIKRMIYQCNDDCMLVFLYKISPLIRSNRAVVEKWLYRTTSKQKEVIFQVLLVIALQQNNRQRVAKKTEEDKTQKRNNGNQLNGRLREYQNRIAKEKFNFRESLMLLEEIIENPLINRAAESDKNSPIIRQERKVLLEELQKLGQLEKMDNHRELFHPKVSETKTSQSEIEKKFFNEKEGSIIVPHAGLVLLHPFLKQFFKNMDALDENGHIKPESLTVTVQALSFLTTGKDVFFEGNMSFEKFLCGMPLNKPIPCISELTREIKKEAMLLLEETIKNWPALKNTSPEGLQQLFLMRKGKLTKEREGFKLVVERKAQDVLIDKLNWNIAVVKLPWQESLLFVEW